MNIVYSSNNKFAEILGVSLVSLYENNTNYKKIDVYVIDENISEENKDKLQSISSNYNRSPIKWLHCPNLNNLLNLNIATDRGSLSQFSRLMMGSLLPNEVDRVLSLDCDIVINKSLHDLWSTDLKGNTVAALSDCFSKYYRENIGLTAEAIMFNPGVFLVDLNKWRADNVENKLLSYLKEKKGIVQQSDLGVLNHVLSADCFVIDPKYNAVTIFFDFNYQEMLTYRRPPSQYYSEEIIREATNHPYIIHYTSSFLSKRPWMKGCNHRYVYKWLFYKDLTPWVDTPLWSDNRNKLKLFCYFLAKLLPRKALIFVASIFQVYLRPLKNRIEF
ncbi:glycosyltransferase family 8 protein [uncultured Succinivibrio sp.]|uniref:glycosyltransferase family 8 protein n=1 Tax=uncultured Succinivibrio sp. TaxID=540749 RepID=UPI003443D64C